MRAPSNRSGVPATFVILLLALILFLGLALAPRAFEFRAWPEPSRHGAIQEIVERPADQVTEVPVARVKTRADKAPDALAVRGRNPRKESRARHARGGRREGRAGTGSRRGRSGRGAKGGDRGSSAPTVVVEQPAAPQPDLPEPAPEQPAQLAEVPQSEPVRRPDATEVLPEQLPTPLREYDSRRLRENRLESNGSDAGDRGSDCSD